jgi:hypothetical protein
VSGSLNLSQKPAAPKSAARRRRAWIIVVGLLIALSGAAGFGIYHRFFQTPPGAIRRQPYAKHLPHLGQQQEMQVYRDMSNIAQTILRITPQQREKLSAIWGPRLPQTVDELVDYQRRTNEVLTPTQRLVLRPVRRVLRERAIDQIVEPARGHFTPEDFEKLRTAVKARINQRLAGLD